MSRRRSPRPRFAEAAPVFAALGEPTRLALVAKLCAEGPLSIARLSVGAGVTRQAVTKHLITLETAGLVRGSRTGRERIWALEPVRLDEARQYLDSISAAWDVALDRLKAFVET
jgi:DNA-binding transcriptional ArsR family regulator